jgi:hypothetical protein
MQRLLLSPRLSGNHSTWLLRLQGHDLIEVFGLSQGP